MPLRYLLTAAALALSSVLHAQPAALVVPKDETPPPIVKLPPWNPVNVSKYDPNEVKVRDVPYHVRLVKAPEAWAKNPAARGKGIRVAILDTGVQHDHPGFDGRVVGMYDAIRKREGSAPDRHGHGTHCAGIVHSIVPDADLIGIKVLGDDGSGSTADIAHGVDVAVTQFKCDVISMSLGGPQRDPFQEPAIKRAVAAGVVVICAAGNDGPGDTEGFPARLPDSISVAACDRDRKLATFSSHGPNVFTADPGVDVMSLLPGNREGEMSGTSMACPVEAGKCAAWIGSNAVPKTAGRRDLFRAAALAASPFPQRNNARGHGLYTLDRITGEVLTPAPPLPPAPPPGEKVFTLNLADLQRQGYTAVRLELAGTPAGGGSQTIPVASLPAQSGTFPQYIHPPQTVPTWTGGSAAPVFAPPPVVYHTMPQQCPGGVCQPTPLFPRLYRVLR